MKYKHVTMKGEKGNSINLKGKRLTGHSFKSRFKRKREEEAVPEKLAMEKSEKVVKFEGLEEHGHSASSKKTWHVEKKDVQRSQDTNNSGNDHKPKSNVDGGRSSLVKNTIGENSASKKHYDYLDHIPLRQRLALKDKSAESYISSDVNVVMKGCDKRMEMLIQKQKEEIQKFHRVWEDKISELEMDHKLNAVLIRSIYGKSSTLIDRLKCLDCEFSKKIMLKDMHLKDLEAKQLAARNEETQKSAAWLSKAIAIKLTGCCKAQSESRAHILGAMDAVPLIEQHGENNDSSRTVKQGKHAVVRSKNSHCATAEEVACNAFNGNPTSAINSCQKNEGGTTFSDTPISAVVEQINQPKHLGTRESICADLPASGERVPGEMRSIELHKDILQELPATVANKIVDNANAVDLSTNTPIEGFVGMDAIDLPEADHFGCSERISQNLSASGERVSGEVKSLELHGDVPMELPETVADETVYNANSADLSTNTPIEGFGEGDADQLSQPKHFGSAKRIFGNLPASGERAPGEMQSPELCKDIPTELAGTVANQIVVDNVNPVESSANTSIKGFGEEDAIDLPDAFLNQRNETDGTTIDDLDLAGQVLKTSEQTKASQRVREDQEMVSGEVQVVRNANSSHSEVVAPELVDTATNSLSSTEPQAWEEPVIETQSSSRTEVSTSEIIDTLIAEQSSTKLQDQDTSVVKDQVTPQIEVADSERVYTSATIAASEYDGTVKTLQSNNELQGQVEPARDTQSMSRIEVAVSESLNNSSPVLSSTEQQGEDACIVKSWVSLEIEASNSVVADNATPVQSHIDAPPIECDEQLQIMPIDASPSCNQLPSTELESQNHNLGRNSSGAADVEMLSHESTSRLMEDSDVRPESQSSPATRVPISASFQNNVAAEAVPSTTGILHQPVLQLGGVSHLPSPQVAVCNSPSLLSDPLQTELEKIYKESEELKKRHVEEMSGLQSEYAKELEELQKKYQLKFEDGRTQFRLKNDGLNQNIKKVLMNKLLADAGRNSYSALAEITDLVNCLNMWSTWSLMQQGTPSSSLQYQHRVRPAGAGAPNPLQTANLNGQGVQQRSVPPSTRVVPITSQSFVAPSAPAAQLEAISRLWAINGVHPASIPRLGENIHSSSPHFHASIPAAVSSMPSAILSSAFQNLQQLRQQQQPVAASQWQSISQNPQNTSFLPEFSSNFGSLQQSHCDTHTLGHVNQSSCAGATTAICLSDDD